MIYTHQQKMYLAKIYRFYAIHVDRLHKHPKVLNKIAIKFNLLTGLDESAEKLLQYMIGRCKNKTWPLLGRNPKPESRILEDLPFPVPEYAKKIPPMRVLKNSNSKVLKDLKPKFKTSWRKY